MTFDKIIDTLMFREGTVEDESGETQPKVTTGSIVWGVMLRTAISIVLIYLILDELKIHEHWYLILLCIWLFALYPGWRQWQVFQTKIKKISEETLCGSCIHFDKTGQLCKKLDEHITKDYIPCEGELWEPRHFDSIEE